jgi:hypothetical protein
LRIERLRFQSGGRETMAAVDVNGRSVSATMAVASEEVVIHLDEPVTIETGQTLRVVLS